MPFLPLSNSDKIIVLDEADHERLKDFTWSLCSHGKYAQGYVEKYMAGIHRHIMGLKKGDRRTVDHINSNPLDNRRANLRICTYSENTRNRSIKPGRSGYRGVYINNYGAIRAEISVNHEIIHLGMFEDVVSAAKAYDRAARELCGEFARLNFPDEVSA